MWFIQASIVKVNNTCYTLTIISTWYMFFEHKDFYVFSTLEEAKEKLLSIRCKGELTIKE